LHDFVAQKFREVRSLVLVRTAVREGAQRLRKFDRHF